jgi:hypothetical protein
MRIIFSLSKQPSSTVDDGDDDDDDDDDVGWKRPVRRSDEI